jgi:hypothetical protein
VSNTGQRRWSCQRVPGDDSHCGRLVVIADPVDELVEADIVKRLDSPAVARALKQPAKTKQHATVAQVNSLEQQLVQVGLDHDDGLIGRREWLARRGRLEERLEAARGELARENGSHALAPFAGKVDVARRWKGLDLEGKRRVAAALIDRVVILPPTSRTPVFDPDRVDVVWKV